VTTRSSPIGIDFDNTIVDYDRVFAPTAVEMGFLPSDFVGGKIAVRRALRTASNGEERWMRVQGRVYGPRMFEARLFDGVRAFLIRARERERPVFVISHKTERGHFDETGTDLRVAALAWMDDQGLFRTDETGIDRSRVFFEPDRTGKLRRVAELGCAILVDDLPEVLEDPAFPVGVERCLFAPAGAEPRSGMRIHASWRELADALLG